MQEAVFANDLPRTSIRKHAIQSGLFEYGLTYMIVLSIISEKQDGFHE